MSGRRLTQVPATAPTRGKVRVSRGRVLQRSLLSVLGGSTHTHTLPHFRFAVLVWLPCGCYSCTRFLCWKVSLPRSGNRGQDLARAVGAGEQQSARWKVVEGLVGDAQGMEGCLDGRFLLLQSHVVVQVRRGGPRHANTKSGGASRFNLAVLAIRSIRIPLAGYPRPRLLLFSRRRNSRSLLFPLPLHSILDVAGAASGRGLGASRVPPSPERPIAVPPTAENRQAKDEMCVDAATAEAQAAAQAVLLSGVVAPVVAPVVASIRTSPGPREAVRLTAAVGGLQQTLSPSEHALNIGAGLSSAVVSVTATPPSAGDAAASTLTPASLVVGASIRQPRLLPTRSSRKGKGPARPVASAFKPPAHPPRATSRKPGSSAPAATVAGERPPAAKATVPDI